MQLTATSNFLVRSTQTPPAAPPAAEPPAPTSPTEVFTPTTPEPEPAKEKETKRPSWQRVLVHTALGAASGAVYGNWLNNSFSRNLALNVGIAAGAGGAVCGLVGAGIGAFNNEAGKGFLWGAGIGVVGGAALGALDASIDHLIRSAMPFSPAINGAILGGISGALSTPAESLFDQINALRKQKEADKPKD